MGNQLVEILKQKMKTKKKEVKLNQKTFSF